MDKPDQTKSLQDLVAEEVAAAKERLANLPARSREEILRAMLRELPPSALARSAGIQTHRKGPWGNRR